jgi:kynurenine/2-aminoadipate aminotransferase
MFGCKVAILQQLLIRSFRVMLASAIHRSAGRVGTRSISDYTAFLSAASLRRKPSPIRALMPLVKTPGMISLGGGMPNPTTFPFTSLQFTTNKGDTLSLTKAELNEALQYSPTPGLPNLCAQLASLQVREHNPQYKDWSTLVTCGSQDALGKAFEMLLNPGDSVIVEDPTYPGTLSFLQPFGANLLPVKTDAEGIIVSSLEEVLAAKHAKKPRVLYVIPTGQVCKSSFYFSFLF